MISYLLPLTYDFHKWLNQPHCFFKNLGFLSSEMKRITIRNFCSKDTLKDSCMKKVEQRSSDKPKSCASKCSMTVENKTKQQLKGNQSLVRGAWRT